MESECTRAGALPGSGRVSGLRARAPHRHWTARLGRRQRGVRRRSSRAEPRRPRRRVAGLRRRPGRHPLLAPDADRPRQRAPPRAGLDATTRATGREDARTRRRRTFQATPILDDGTLYLLLAAEPDLRPRRRRPARSAGSTTRSRSSPDSLGERPAGASPSGAIRGPRRGGACARRIFMGTHGRAPGGGRRRHAAAPARTSATAAAAWT